MKLWFFSRSGLLLITVRGWLIRTNNKLWQLQQHCLEKIVQAIKEHSTK